MNDVPQHRTVEYNYKGVLSLQFQPSQEVLTKEFMDEHDIQIDNQVAILDGKDFDARKFGYNKIIADSD